MVLSLLSIRSKTSPKNLAHLSPNHIHPSSEWAIWSFSSSSFSPTSSFSSSSTFNSPSTPSSPIRSFGIPFSWEHQPGIPKLSHFPPPKYKNLPLNLLPLPPSVHRLPKKKSHCSIRRDPFVSALVKCSKEGHREANTNRWMGISSSKPLADRIGYVSCKAAPDVAESTVYIPRSNRMARSLVGRRGG